MKPLYCGVAYRFISNRSSIDTLPPASPGHECHSQTRWSFERATYLCIPRDDLLGTGCENLVELAEPEQIVDMGVRFVECEAELVDIIDLREERRDKVGNGACLGAAGLDDPVAAPAVVQREFRTSRMQPAERQMMTGQDQH